MSARRGGTRRSVHVETARQASTLALITRGEKYRTTHLDVSYEFAAGWMERIVAQLTGVKELFIDSSPGLAPFFLELPALTGEYPNALY